MKVAFRVDASLQMGTGHVMRCLTLANALKLQGCECQFISREHPGNLIAHILHQGFKVHTLPLATTNVSSNSEPRLSHELWLGATQQQDATECSALLRDLQIDWLIVDHYALDARWEIAIKEHYSRLMVIDDLADRNHECDLLLDQTFGRDISDYAPWTPSNCTLLCGSSYSLLRPEFSALREFSLQRRKKAQLQHLLITMGGVDKDNATGQILLALQSSELPADCRISVVMGATAPWLAEVCQLADQLRWPTEVKVGISDMAQLMAESDLAIGAAGATTWERCCLGLPSIMLILADNQRGIAQALSNAGAADLINMSTLDYNAIITNKHTSSSFLAEMSSSASAITDGLGTFRVISNLKIKG